MPKLKIIKEAPKDAKVLRNINIDYLKKEIPKDPDEEIRDYFSRLQNLEKDPNFTNPIFPQVLIDYVESLPDNHFPDQGRKRFAKWLGNAIYHHQAEILLNRTAFERIEDLYIYTNDVRYITDYLNGADDLPDDLWENSINGMFDLAVQWHENFKNVESTGEYSSKNVVFKFDNGFVIVEVPAEDLEIEGNKMGHCVGGYCDAVSQGQATIYSLRSPKNEPHVTFEVRNNKIDQIKGKENQAPVEKYRGMIKSWLASTDLDYKSSGDYISILSDEEQIELINDGEADPRVIYNLATRTESSSFIDYCLDIVSEWYLGHPERIRSLKDVNAGSLLVSLSNNRFLSLNQAVKVLEINLKSETLGDSVQYMFQAPIRDMGDTRPDADELSRAAWDQLGHKLRSNLTTEKLFCLRSMVYYTNEEALRVEIIEFLLQNETLDSLLLGKIELERVGEVLKHVLMAYLRPQISLNEKSAETLTRIYDFVTSEKAKAFSQDIERRVEGYIAQAESLTNTIAEKIFLKYSGEASRSNHHVLGYLLKNKAVNDDLKKEVLKNIVKLSDSETHANPGVFRRYFAKVIAQNYKDYSNEFIKWAANEGYLDDYFKDMIEKETAGFARTIFDMDPNEIQKQIDRKKREWLQANITIPEKVSEEDRENYNYFSEISESIQGEVKKYLSTKAGVAFPIDEIKDYFNSKNNKHEKDDYMQFEGHPQASLEKLLDEKEPAPWD